MDREGNDYGSGSQSENYEDQCKSFSTDPVVNVTTTFDSGQRCLGRATFESGAVSGSRRGGGGGGDDKNRSLTHFYHSCRSDHVALAVISWHDSFVTSELFSLFLDRVVVFIFSVL